MSYKLEFSHICIAGLMCLKSELSDNHFTFSAGVPLPVIGFVMYGLVTALSAQLGEGNLPFGISKTDGRFALFATTTAMASASAYFLYILSTKLSGSSCPYCLVSAFLSFTLFFLCFKVSLYIRFSYILGLIVFRVKMTFMCSCGRM